MASLKTIRKIAIAAALAIPVMALGPAPQAHAAVFISVGFAPPVLPVYVQPLCPGDGYMWTPGYWAYSDDGGYYWVPGVWVLPPEEGVLWTPAYWGWENGVYLFHTGYWGPHIGFYGGINYGFGYGGFGFDGGYWDHGAFFYNRRVANLGVGFRGAHVYDRPVAFTNHSNVAFNGGHGGIDAHPRPEELHAMEEHHIEPTHDQVSHESVAAHNPAQHFSANNGHPGVTAARSPDAFRTNPAGAPHSASASRATQPSPAAKPAQPPNHTQAPAPRPQPQAQPKSQPAPHPQAAPHPAPASHPAPQPTKH